jgi:hypothetical protein
MADFFKCHYRYVMGACVVAVSAGRARRFVARDLNQANPAERIKYGPQRTKVATKHHGNDESSYRYGDRHDYRNYAGATMPKSRKDYIEWVVSAKNKFAVL